MQAAAAKIGWDKKNEPPPTYDSYLQRKGATLQRMSSKEEGGPYRKILASGNNLVRSIERFSKNENCVKSNGQASGSSVAACDSEVRSSHEWIREYSHDINYTQGVAAVKSDLDILESN